MAKWVKVDDGKYVNIDQCESIQVQTRFPSERKVIMFTSNSGDKFTMDYNSQKVELKKYLNDSEF